MSKLGERIKSLRKQRGFTNQKRLADALGIKQQQLSLYERGIDPKPELIAKIADILNTTTDYLIGRTDDPNPPLRLSPDERAILEPLLRRIREGGSVTFDEVAEAWLDNLSKDPGLDDFGKP